MLFSLNPFLSLVQPIVNDPDVPLKVVAVIIIVMHKSCDPISHKEGGMVRASWLCP